MLRFVIWLPIAAVLGGCATSGAPLTADPVSAERLQAQQKGVVIVHTSMHDQVCQTITALLAQPNEAGQFVSGPTVTLRHPFAVKQAPGNFEVPAGEYGFVHLRCQTGNQGRNYNARIAKRGSVLDGTKTIYEAPIAKFTVRPGEVVDIGSLRLPSRPIRATGLFQAPKSEFMAIITPMPDEWLKKLAEAEPELYKARIVRPMMGATRI